MTGRPDTTDPLDRIEETARLYFAPGRVTFGGEGPLARDVLALVAVARAARELAEVGNHTDTCDFVLETDAPLPCSCGRHGVLAALARLDGAR